jgi:hypothetical protein
MPRRPMQHVSLQQGTGVANFNCALAAAALVYLNHKTDACCLACAKRPAAGLIACVHASALNSAALAACCLRARRVLDAALRVGGAHECGQHHRAGG